MAVVFSMFDDLETYCDLIYSQTGRKPSGLCGAALYISALSHGYKFSKSDIVSPAYHIDVCNLLRYILGKVPSGISVVYSELFPVLSKLLRRKNNKGSE